MSTCLGSGIETRPRIFNLPPSTVEGKAEGRAEGKAEALLCVLRARGFDVSRSQRAAILACGELAQLDAWLARAVSASSVDALLGPTP